MKNPKTYRDIPRQEVEAYADAEGLNIETAENFREAAIDLFNTREAETADNSKDNNESPYGQD